MEQILENWLWSIARMITIVGKTDTSGNSKQGNMPPSLKKQLSRSKKTEAFPHRYTPITVGILSSEFHSIPWALMSRKNDTWRVWFGTTAGTNWLRKHWCRESGKRKILKELK